MQYIGFAPEEGALKGSWLQVKAIISHISRVHITPDTPHLTVVQYARVVALLLLGGTMCPDSSGNLVSLLYLAKLEDIVEARNYSWGSAVLAFLYRELCNASEKGKAAIGGALQLVQVWAWSRIIPLCPGLGAPRVHMGPHQIDNNRVLPGAPYGAMWNCEHTFTRTVRTTVRVIRDILDEMQYDQPYDMESNVIMAYAGDFNPQLWRSICPLIFYAIVEMHHPKRVLRQFGMMQNIPDQPDTRDMSLHKITRSNRTGTDWILQHILYIIRWQRRYDTVIQRQPISNRRDTDRGYWEWYNNITRHFVSSSTDRRVESGYQPGDAPVLHMVICFSYFPVNFFERGDIGVDIAGPSTAYTPQDYYVPQPPQIYYVPQPSQDDWFQSTSYMPSHAEAYSSHVDLDIGFGINQPYAPEYNISPVLFPSFSAYCDNVESSSAASSSGLHINSGGDDNDGQNEPIQNMGEEIRRPRRQRHRRGECTERMHNIRRGGVSMKSKWLNVLRSSCKGLEHRPSNAVSDVGFAEFSSLATGRSLMNDFSRRVCQRFAFVDVLFSADMFAKFLFKNENSILPRDQWTRWNTVIFQSPFQLATSTGQTMGSSCFTRTLASKTTESNRQKQSETRKEISTVEDPFDAPTYNIPEKPVTFTEGASYSLVILAGLGIAAAAAYGVFKELIFEPKEYKIFNKALERVQNDSQVRVRIGSPITGYGSESRNRAARQRIPHKTWTDEEGVEHVVVNFHIRGPHGAGKVYSEMFKDKVEKQWKFMYLIVEVTSPSPAQLMLESYVPA
ncbi:UNVERIFIED_CONTAM: putative mitochondrial import inner membrane translocase subunit TIM21 [Sesamum calycinum]|uniref:Mitochondrial import inner membrane translocase subunit TIM21 n=2 Tax=Sesamum TaxID=4181 RepID=A0AAW2NZ34_9LAMI